MVIVRSATLVTVSGALIYLKLIPSGPCNDIATQLNNHQTILTRNFLRS
jgi:hypothetical protein